MKSATQPSLTIQEIEQPYGGDHFKGRLFAAMPECSKPRTVTADQWCQQVLEMAEASGFKHLVVQWSFWPEGCPLDAIRLGPQYVQIMDTVAGIELLRGETPEQGLEKVARLLRDGQDLLVVSASPSVPGFIPAALMQMSEPAVHIVKIWYPTVIGQGYELTPFQIGYLAGRGSPAWSYIDQTEEPGVLHIQQNGEVFEAKSCTTLARKTLKDGVAG